MKKTDTHCKEIILIEALLPQKRILEYLKSSAKWAANVLTIQAKETIKPNNLDLKAQSLKSTTLRLFRLDFFFFWFAWNAQAKKWKGNGRYNHLPITDVVYAGSYPHLTLPPT